MTSYPVLLCDISFQHPNYICLAQQGYTGVYRYVGPGSGKLLTRAEALNIHTAGLDLGFLVEGAATDDLLGYPEGVLYARMAVNAVAALGLPVADPMFVHTADHDTTAANIGAVIQYFRGVNAVVPATQVGCYGDVDICTALRSAGLATWFILADAPGWNPGQPAPPWMNALQGPNGINVCGGNIDVVRAQTTPPGMWYANGENDMMFVRDSAGQAWVADGITRRPVAAADEADVGYILTHESQYQTGAPVPVANINAFGVPESSSTGVAAHTHVGGPVA